MIVYTTLDLFLEKYKDCFVKSKTILIWLDVQIMKKLKLIFDLNRLKFKINKWEQYFENNLKDFAKIIKILRIFERILKKLWRTFPIFIYLLNKHRNYYIFGTQTPKIKLKRLKLGEEFWGRAPLLTAYGHSLLNINFLKKDLENLYNLHKNLLSIKRNSC